MGKCVGDGPEGERDEAGGGIGRVNTTCPADNPADPTI
jgi:hypothetical protein